MSTVSLMAHTNSTIANLTAKGVLSQDIAGASVKPDLSKPSIGSNSSAYELSDSLNSILSGKKPADASSINTMWNAYTGSVQSASQDIYSSLQNAYAEGQKYINGIATQKATLSSLVKDYTTTKDTFNAQLAGSLNDLADAAYKMRKEGYYVKGATDEDTQKNVAAVVKNVKDFLGAYNDTNDFMQEHKDVSKRMTSLASTYGDNGYFASSLSKIGISVGKDGKLSLDEARLSKALTDNNSAASYTLDSLGKRSNDKALKTAGQFEKLFPSISQMMGSDIDSTKKLYAPNTLNLNQRYENIGNMLNLYL